MTTAEDIAGALGGKRSGSGWIARCPAHDDQNPSLSLSDGESGLLWHCFGGCSQEAVADALRQRGLLPSPGSNQASHTSSRSGFSTPEELAAWLARKASATVTRIDLYSPNFAEIRLDGPNGKTYRPIHRIPDGGWKTGDPPGKLPLYQIDQLPSDPEVPILVCEGPKCVEAARKLGFSATTSAHGSGAARKADWSPLGDRREILIWPDSDLPGRRYATDVLAWLVNVQGVPRSAIRILDPGRFGLDEGEDIADWVEKHPGEIPDLSRPKDSPEGPGGEAWWTSLDRTPAGKLVANARSLGLILRNDPKFSSLRFNEFSVAACHNDTVLDEALVFRWREYVETQYGRGCIVPENGFLSAVEAIATEHKFHPVRDWLGSLEWDGSPRIDRLVTTYFGGKDTEYTRAVSRNFLIGATARIMQPGVKLDTMPVFEGPQGILKSSSVAALFGDEWTAEMKADLHNKDFEGSLVAGVWSFEFAELESLGRAGIHRIKMQLSTRTDWVRLSYRRDNHRYPRQCVFWGTSNDTEYLRDATGARRFWPIKCGRIDIEAIRHDRDQLWAEAVHRYKAGESWWKVPAAEAEAEQEARYQMDSWEELIRPWLAGKDEITMTEVLGDCLEIEIGRRDRAAETRVGNALKRCGWQKVRVRRGKELVWIYRPPDPVPTSEVGTGVNMVGTSSTDAIVPTVPTHKDVPSPQVQPGPFANNNNKMSRNSRNGRNKPILEPCSYVVPTSPKTSEIGTNGFNFTEVE